MFTKFEPGPMAGVRLLAYKDTAILVRSGIRFAKATNILITQHGRVSVSENFMHSLLSVCRRQHYSYFDS
jgi:hypothetical protein